MSQNLKFFPVVFLSVFFANIFTVYFSHNFFPTTSFGWEINIIASVVAGIIATIIVFKKNL